MATETTTATPTFSVGSGGSVTVVDPATGKKFSVESARGQELAGDTDVSAALADMGFTQTGEGTAEVNPDFVPADLPEPTAEVTTEDTVVVDDPETTAAAVEEERAELADEVTDEVTPEDAFITPVEEVTPEVTTETTETTGITPVEEAVPVDAAEITPEEVAQPEGFELTDELSSLEQVALTAGLDEDALVRARQAYTDGYLTEETYKEYLEARATASAAESTIEDQQFPEFTYEKPSSLVMADFFSDIASMDFSSMATRMGELIESGELSEVSSAALNSLLLTSMQLESSNAMQDRWQGVYDRMAGRAQDAYEATIDNAEVAQTEIDNIISGTSDTATTINSLMVKVQKQQADLGATSIDAMQSALTAEYEYTYNNMLEQNSRLEGYMKAKLNSMGAQDSSAGLTMMSLTIDNAQQRLLLYQSNYTSEMVQLEVQKTQLMNDYYNSVTEQLINIENDKATAYTTYEDKMVEIEANELASLQESETQMLTAMQSLTSQLYTIEQDQKAWEYQEATDTYNRAFNEAAVARDIESQFKAEAASKMDMLLSAYAGLSFDQIDPEGQQALVELAQAVGLPESFARDALQGIIRGTASTGPGSAGDPFSDYTEGQITDAFSAYTDYQNSGFADSMGFRLYLDSQTGMGSSDKAAYAQIIALDAVYNGITEAEVGEVVSADESGGFFSGLVDTARDAAFFVGQGREGRAAQGAEEAFAAARQAGFGSVEEHQASLNQ